MQTVSPEDLLALTERAAPLHAIDRAIRLLALAMPDRDPSALARLPLGTRDGLLLAVRNALLGDRLEAQDACPGCGARVEALLDGAALAAGCSPPPAQWTIESDGCRLTLRALDSLDAAAAAQSDDVGGARTLLITRAVISAERAGAPIAVEDMPPHLASTIADSIAKHDSGAELLLQFSCPSCERIWTGVLDVASFVWRELAVRAERLLYDVHTLARAYGWSEAEILAMSSARRSAYVALVTG
jgi:hypothetical protein